MTYLVPLGIDFGQATCFLAGYDRQRPRLIANATGVTSTPTVVTTDSTGQTVAGAPALKHALLRPDLTAERIKRRLATDWTIQLAEKRCAAEGAAALLFAQLREDAERTQFACDSSCVLTAPSGFTARQRQALRRAAEHGGWTVQRIISDPGAAAMRLALEDRADTRRLLLDAGAGSLDVALISHCDGVCEVDAVAGDADLGADDWQDTLLDLLLDRVWCEYGADLSQDAVAVRRLREAAHEAMLDLSASTSTRVRVRYLTPAIESLQVDLTRSEFENLAGHLMLRCEAIAEEILADAGTIHELVLHGGASHLPMVERWARTLVPSGRWRRLASGALAEGAALQAAVMDGQLHDSLLLDAR